MQAAHGLLHGLEQVAGVQVVDQVGDDLGVGLAFEDVAGGLQLGAQFVVVLDDAVVDQRDARLVIAQVRKCGWALCVAGTPWVAQRVWAMPVKPVTWSWAIWSLSSATRCVLRVRRRWPSA